MTEVTTYTGLKIWAGNGTGYLDADAITIQGARIARIGDRADAPTDGRQVNCEGLTAVPGLIDAHVHLELNPDHSKPPERTKDSVVPLMRERAARMASAGITTARDLGGGAWYELDLRDAIARGGAKGPRLICSGQPITCPQGHCHFWGGEASNIEEAKAVLKRQVDHKVDLIKVMATGGRLTAGSAPTDAQFSQAVLDEIVTTAHGLALPVAAHCHGTEGIRRAATAGVDTIEHCSWVGSDGWASDYQADVAQVILDQGVWVSPTVNRGWQRMLDSETGAVLKRVRTAYRKMLDLGIPMLASTDAGIPGVYHEDLPHALVVFAKIAQLSNEEALRSATSDAAKALQLAEVTGRLEPGLDADLMIVDGDPLEDLTAITRPVFVLTRGRRAL